MASPPKKILVATDFSSTAEGAEKFGHRLAHQLGAELHLVHVRVILDDPLMAEEKRLEVEKLVASTDAATRKTLDNELPSKPGVTVQTHLVRSISAAEAIVETASDLGCELIVMGTHGRRGFRHLLVGSVAERVVRSVDIPVLTVRPGVNLADDWPVHVLVTHDFSDHSAAAVKVADSWASALDAELTVLHVVEPVVYPELYALNVVPDDVMTKLRDRAIEALDESVQEILGTRPRNTSVLIGPTADTIIGEAEAPSIDLVVMGTRGLSGFQQFVLGSVAESVLRRCPEPLLTVSSES